MKKAFTLIEILMVIAIVGVIIGFSIFFQNKITQTSFIIDESVNLVINALNLAKQKAIIGEENDNWGVLLVNTSTDYIYLFKGNTNNLKERFNLPKEVSFFDFNTTTIIFQKITGQTSSTTIKIGFSRGGIFKYIKVSNLGNIKVSDNP
jgi:prepilin-type N-terminal cleavage/methylation domain-containing protein